MLFYPGVISLQASEKRLNTLKDKISHLEEGGAEGEEEEMEGEDEEDPEVSRMMEQERDEVPEDELCEKMFKGKKFFLAREVNRESLFFVLKSFGGEVGWDGPQSPFDDSDEDITHHVCDRPTQVRAMDYLTQDRAYEREGYVYEGRIMHAGIRILVHGIYLHRRLLNIPEQRSYWKERKHLPVCGCCFD
jgi:hypothetical protein